MSQAADSSPTSPDPMGAVQRELPYKQTTNLAPLLEQLGISLLVSTYQAGKVVIVGVPAGTLALSVYNFQRAMGLAVRPGCIAVGTHAQIWFLRSVPQLVAQLEPAGRYDACFLAHSAFHTGAVRVHDIAWAGQELWFVNTLFSCLCTMHKDFSFVPRWRPPFVTGLGPEDRCHLNGLLLVDGKPRYVTALAETDTPAGWRPDKATAGCLIDVPSGATVVRGLAMPHSPRAHRDQLWLLHSGLGSLVRADPARGTVETIAELPGYTRGLAFQEGYAFVGLSKIRESSMFGDMPIAQRRPELKCGVAVVDLDQGRSVALLEFLEGVEEIFDVQVLPGVRFPAVSGPHADREGAPVVWMLPQPRT